MNEYMTTPFDFDDLAYLAVPLPDDIAALLDVCGIGDFIAGSTSGEITALIMGVKKP